ncbi:MAG TPA: mevalonate kinase [Chloroflexi bacterium]|nr:mevalonate kinase [Chloroflexota bacterium]
MSHKRSLSSAPGKVILFGEHAVVYGRPAIAAPVTQVQASAAVTPAAPGSGLLIAAPDLGRQVTLSTAPPDDPLAAATRLTLAHLSAPEPDGILTIHSTIPIASGLGSGAAVSTALVRALGSLLGRKLPADSVSEIVFEVEKIHHGTPSGIDNTVIAFEQPIYFVRERPVQRLRVAAPFTLVIADTGIRSPTKKIVAHVRRAWKREPAHYDALFDQIGDVTDEARRAIEAGQTSALGPLMDENHELLIEMGVSSPILDELVEAARFAGALGAKLSGAGQGGAVIALVEETADLDLAEIIGALTEAGARWTICTQVDSPYHAS